MSYYRRSNLEKIPELVELAPQAAQSFLSFEHQVYHESNAIPLKMKELIAVAVAHVTGCPYCIDVHARKFVALGGTREEIFEAVLVATSTRAGAILSHATHFLAALDKDDSQQGATAAESPPPSAPVPDCFC